MGQLSHLNSWPQLVYPFPRCQCGPHSAWSLQLLADTLISQTSHSCTSHSSCWLITWPFRLRERSCGWHHMGTKCQLLDLPNFCLHWLKHADMGDIQQEKKRKKFEYRPKKVREWNACWCCTNVADGKWNCRLFPLCPLYLFTHPSI